MRRGLRERKPVMHYGEIQTFEGSDNEEDASYDFMPRRILPARLCNIKNQNSNENYSSHVPSTSRMSREKREMLKQIDIKFKFESYENMKDEISDLLELVKEHETSWPFLEPVPKEVPLYYQIIQHPIDLSTIQQKIDNYAYSSEDDMFDDLNLMFENCKTFNEPGTDIFKAGLGLRKYVLKLQKQRFPDFEDVDPESIIIDRVQVDANRPKNETSQVKNEATVEETAEDIDTSFDVSTISPMNNKIDDTTLERNLLLTQQCSAINEIALFFWLLGNTDYFKIEYNKDFTLSLFERAFCVPHQSKLFLSLHFLLVGRATELKKLREIFKTKPDDSLVIPEGTRDSIDAHIYGSQFNIGRLVERFYEKFEIWNRTRNSLKRDYDFMDSGELEFSLAKFEQIEVELEFYNELLFPFRDNLQQSLSEFSEEEEIDVFPFEDLNSFIELSPVRRVLITQALISWRLLGYQDQNIISAIRLLEAESLMQLPMGTDYQGSKYYYFSQFFNECRVYKQTPRRIEAFDNYLQRIEDLSSLSEVKSLQEKFEKLKMKKYSTAEKKIADLRSLKAKLKRKKAKRDGDEVLNLLMDDFENKLREGFFEVDEVAELITQVTFESENMYPIVSNILNPLLPTPKQPETYGFIGIPADIANVEISESEVSENESSTTSGRQQDDVSSMEDEEEEEIVEKEETKVTGRKKRNGESASGEAEIGDFMFDGSDYHPIRRSGRARKQVKRLEATFSNDRKEGSSGRKKQSRIEDFFSDSDSELDRKKKKKRKAKSKPKVSNKKQKLSKKKATGSVKAEVSEIQSLINQLLSNPLDERLDDELTIKFNSLKKDLHETFLHSLPEPSSWVLLCKSNKELKALVSSLSNDLVASTLNSLLLTELNRLLEFMSEKEVELRLQKEREEKKQMKMAEILSAPRKRSSRIQHEQEKISQIREVEEMERIQDIRSECAQALWDSYSRKRRKDLENERKILRLRHEQKKQKIREQEEEQRKQREYAEVQKARELRARMEQKLREQELQRQQNRSLLTSQQQRAVQNLPHQHSQFQGYSPQQQAVNFVNNNANALHINRNYSPNGLGMNFAHQQVKPRQLPQQYNSSVHSQRQYLSDQATNLQRVYQQQQSQRQAQMAQVYKQQLQRSAHDHPRQPSLNYNQFNTGFNASQVQRAPFSPNLRPGISQSSTFSNDQFLRQAGGNIATSVEDMRKRQQILAQQQQKQKEDESHGQWHGTNYN